MPPREGAKIWAKLRDYQMLRMWPKGSTFEAQVGSKGCGIRMGMAFLGNDCGIRTGMGY